MCSELVPEIWSFAKLNLPTTSTNVTWIDTNAWVQSGYPVQCIRRPMPRLMLTGMGTRMDVRSWCTTLTPTP